MVEFSGKILFVGYGAVAHCTLPILLQHVRVPLTQISIMDFEDRGEDLRPWTEQGVNWIRERVGRENLRTVLAKHLSPGDLLIDLAWNIDCCEILQWCHDHQVMYLNTSVEVWDPYAGGDNQHPTERTLYWRHMNVRRLISRWEQPGATAVLEHGANPGLISHFTKQALLDIAAKLEEDGELKGAYGEQVR
ncbi:MAG: saccharopine dehydrogenase NADP-binding domain-containing protein, partial [Planctomycetota bacterium]